ncbi:hypothetical protein ACQ4LE_009889 [Meloidogyne hapla]
MKLFFMIKLAVFLTFIFCVNKINSTIENGKSVAVDNFSTLIRTKRGGLENCFSKFAYDDCSNRMKCCKKYHSKGCSC